MFRGLRAPGLKVPDSQPAKATKSPPGPVAQALTAPVGQAPPKPLPWSAACPPRPRDVARDATRKWRAVGGAPGVAAAAAAAGMFSAGAESLLRQAREIQAEELTKFCSRIVKLLQEEELGPEAADALQRLFLIVSATKYRRKLEDTCVHLLQATLCSPKCPEQLQLLCAAILREMSPCDGLSLSCDHIHSSRQLSLVASVLLAQGDKKEEVRSVGQRVFRVLESRQPEGPSPRHLLPVVSKITHLAPHTLHEDQTNLLNKRLVDWLRYASVQQGVAHTSGGFFSTPRARQPCPVTEVDGAVATDFFTVLSTGQHFTEDQWLNVQAFSMLRVWLLHGDPEGPSTPDADDRSELEGSTLSVLSASSTASHLLPPRERLREKAFEYCQRLVEQSTRH
uniref:Adaptor related protein complex 5 subunit zeta 1 n=1 Tax=Suricata suricatta TaxID=37032 RepID=A0A673T1Y1_SURSU